MKKTNEELKKTIIEKSKLSAEEKEKIYKTYFKNWQNQHEYLLKRFDISFNEKILDIGCGYGNNLIHFPNDSIGIEANPTIAEFGQSLGLNILPINVEDDLLTINQKFNLIWCSDLLVHVVSPYKFLHDCRNVLKEKGRIIIQIPLMSIFNKHRSTCHLYSFNKKSLLYLLEMAGFNVIKTSGFIRKKPRWFNYIFEPLLQIYGGNIWFLAEKKIETPVNFQKVCFPKWFKI